MTEQHTDYVTIREFTALSERVARAELAIENAGKDNTSRFDKIIEQITNLRVDMLSYRNRVLMIIVGWFVSFLIGGGGILGILSAFHLLR